MMNMLTLLRRRRRLLARVLALLILGAIVNIAVAWGLAFFQGHVLEEAIRQDRARAGARRLPGSHQALLVAAYPSVGTTWYMIAAPDAETVPWEKVLTDPESILPHWAGHRESGRLIRPAEHQFSLIDARGWPSRTAWLEYRDDDGRLKGLNDLAKPQFNVHGGVVLSHDSWRFGLLLMQRALPVRPIWGGFAINTIFYAALLWLLFAAPVALRRHLRIRRGQCPACAYPVGEGPVCTECGKPVKAKSVGSVT